MENTLENKAKFFAQYWGQEILESPFFPELGANRKVGEKTGVSSFINLRPIKQMTLQEGQLFLDTFFKFNDNCEVINIIVLTAKAVIIEFKYPDNETPEDEDGFSYGSVTIDADSTSYEYIDWWRFNGFAVSWMGLEVPKLIEYGWIKLKE